MEFAAMLQARFFLEDQKIYTNPKKGNQPRVSIVLPTYARGDNGLLERAIESVLSQSYGDFELLVIDDGSTDGTADVVAKYVRSDSRVAHVRHDLNSGLPALRVNEGLLLSKGEYCAYQFDDDRWTPDALKLRIEALDKNPDYGVAYGCAMARIGKNEGRLGGPFSYDRLVDCNYIANNTVLHRRKVFENYGGYDMHLVMRRLCDWDLWLRWGKHTRFYFLDEVLSLVDANMENSLGLTVQYDLFASRFQMAHDRDASLTPESLLDYRVDDLERFRALGDERVDEIWRSHIAPYRSRHRELWTAPKTFISRKTHVVVTKAHYDTNVDITIHNLAVYLGDQYVFSFIPSAQLTEDVLGGADIILFHRTIDEHAETLQAFARRIGKATVYLMDDDLLSMHELDPAFSYLAPGASGYETVARQMRMADLTIVYSPLMAESARQHSDRVIELSTNIESKWLQSALPENKRLRIAFAGSSARKEELATLWPALVKVSEQHGDAIEFHFWGFAPEDADELKSPVFTEPFTFSYNEYLARLTQAGFDLMLAPLSAEKRAKRAKCPIKFLEATAAGALGLYSDVEPYEAVQEGVTGIKCGNSPDAWAKALSRAIGLSVGERHEYVRQARARVETDFSAEVQAGSFGAALEAARLHSMLRVEEGAKPRIAFAFHSPYQGGAENHLLRHARLAAEFGFEPIAVFPFGNEGTDHEIVAACRKHGFAVHNLPLRVETEPVSRAVDQLAVDSISNWLKAERIKMVHSVTLIQELGRACAASRVPHVASLYQVETNSDKPVLHGHCHIVHSDSLLYANAWAKLLGARARCIRSHVPKEYFAQGSRRGIREGSAPPRRIGVFGTVQPRKGQLQAIEAVGRLRAEQQLEFELHFYGYTHFFKDYVTQCEQAVKKFGLQEAVFFHGFRNDTAQVLAETDITLCASDWESLPQVILESMAAEVLVIAPNVGGISEIISNHSGVLVKDNSVDQLMKGLLSAYEMSDEERKGRIGLARRVVTAESSHGAVARALFRVYSDAVESLRRAAGDVAEVGFTGAYLSDEPLGGAFNTDVARHRASARAFAVAIRNT
ncbi:hypothetical protein A9P79_23560 [Cupriavidus taiwanensis]|uniref:glycosyltransferase n=1 Tax=Cupriavidus taiwanensis TaxID=164546 RepID=UPI001F03011A|nr:glycosyltransferase [Cupriavidus taiwanensis]ULX54837.1 hypothetical protein A9P79_23560 [Cupriavidus taiwanensis]